MGSFALTAFGSPLAARPARTTAVLAKLRATARAAVQTGEVVAVLLYGVRLALHTTRCFGES